MSMCVSQFRRCVLAIIYAGLYLIQGSDSILLTLRTGHIAIYIVIWGASKPGVFENTTNSHTVWFKLETNEIWRSFQGHSRDFRSVAKVWLYVSEIRRSPVEVGRSLVRYLQGFYTFKVYRIYKMYPIQLGKGSQGGLLSLRTFTAISMINYHPHLRFLTPCDNQKSTTAAQCVSNQSLPVTRQHIPVESMRKLPYSLEWAKDFLKWWWNDHPMWMDWI